MAKFRTNRSRQTVYLTPRGEGSPVIGVVGLWHLGCVISSVFSDLKHRVIGVDVDAPTVRALNRGHAPLFEPGVDEAIARGLKSKRLTFHQSFDLLANCDVIFVAQDTPVDDEDRSDLAPLNDIVSQCAPRLKGGAIMVVSAQVGVGTCRRWRSQLKACNASVELVCSPENLRLGEALACYAHPGRIVVGADHREAGDRVARLFAPMKARIIRMNLSEAEMVKHGINAFLATSITFANQLADLCENTGSDFHAVVQGIRSDSRIGEHSYLNAGLGFSGGTLGRDLRLLQAYSERDGNGSPLFGEVWRYNRGRSGIVAKRLHQYFGGLKGKTVGVLGLTYKPGTSTLRRSQPMEVVSDLVRRGARVKAYDPQADFSELEAKPKGLTRVASALEAGDGADAVVLLTAWPEFSRLDLARLATRMRGKVFFDTKNFYRDQPGELFGDLDYWCIGHRAQAPARG